MNDVLSDARQEELDEVAGRLADWGTDRFLLECALDDQARMDSLYAAYRAGDFRPTEAGERNEIFQLGFRAADLVGRSSELWVGFPDHHVGADLVGEWYKRNLRSYANIWRAVEEGDDRVVVLVGQGHVWTLRTFLRENPDFEVVPVEEVL